MTTRASFTLSCQYLIFDLERPEPPFELRGLILSVIPKVNFVIMMKEKISYLFFFIPDLLEQNVTEIWFQEGRAEGD